MYVIGHIVISLPTHWEIRSKTYYTGAVGNVFMGNELINPLKQSHPHNHSTTVYRYLKRTISNTEEHLDCL